MVLCGTCCVRVLVSIIHLNVLFFYFSGCFFVAYWVRHSSKCWKWFCWDSSDWYWYRRLLLIGFVSGDVGSDFISVSAAIPCLKQIETIGDAYCVAGGLHKKVDSHAKPIAHMALKMMELSEEVLTPDGKPIKVSLVCFLSIWLNHALFQSDSYGCWQIVFRLSICL